MNSVAESISDRSELLFLRYGIKSISMDDICKDLGISKKTLYQHVGNKNELVKMVLFSTMEAQKAKVSDLKSKAKDPIEELLLFAKSVIEMLVQMSPTTMYDLRKYYRELWAEIDAERRQMIYEDISANLVEGKGQKIYREDIDIDLIASLYVRMSTFMFDQKAIDAPRSRKIELYYEFVKYHIRGIATQSGHDLLNQYEYFWHE